MNPESAAANQSTNKLRDSQRILAYLQGARKHV